jgi:ankyrin repeat protein
LLLANKADVNARDNNGDTPLYNAASRGHKDVTELLLAHKAEVNAENNDGDTSLYAAAMYGRKAIAELLRQHGGVDTSSAARKIQDGAKSFDLAKVQALLKGNPGLVFSKDGQEGMTPLHAAATMSGNKDVVECLLANKADVNAKDNVGRTPLHVAAWRGAVDVAETLLAHGAEINAKDNKGQTPLHLAAEMDHEQVAELLLANKAEANAKDNNGSTPLHRVAAVGYYMRMVELLLANKADVNVKDNHGATPMQVAEVHGHGDVAELLRQHGGHE